MTGYIGLGSRQVTAVADTTGNNVGNWTNVFSSAVLGINVPQFQVYRGVVLGAPAGASAMIALGARTISFTAPGVGGGSEWDPQQPPEIEPTQELYFYWSAAASGKPPVVTLWLRYNPDVVQAIQRKAFSG